MRAAKQKEQTETRTLHEALNNACDVQTWLDSGRKGGLAEGIARSWRGIATIAPNWKQTWNGAAKPSLC